METEIGNIVNYYGGLTVKKIKSKYKWSIEDWDGKRWEEIPKYLYDALIKFNKSPN